VSARLVFPDPDAAADVLTFSSRASRLGDGAVRLRALDGTMVITAAPLSPRGLLDPTPTILALRVARVDPELECDLVVEASALTGALDDPSAVSLPESAVTASWAGVSPPRAGWVEEGAVRASELAARAQWGIAAVTDGVPANAGEDAVRAVRAQVWGEPDAAIAGLPRGVAFAAFALGFIAGEEDAALRTAGAWSRLTLSRGHVLSRGPLRSGLTPVRRTGATPA
jgi:hypothetical protein